MYRIEIYRHNHRLEDAYETNYIEAMLFWYGYKWRICIERGSCYFYLYKDGKKLEFTKVKELGFYDRID